MPDMLFYLFWLVMFLTTWAVIGHGLWLIAAAVLKAMFAEPESTSQRTCPTCGRKSLVAGRCAYCHQLPLLGSSPFKPRRPRRRSGICKRSCGADRSTPSSIGTCARCCNWNRPVR